MKKRQSLSMALRGIAGALAFAVSMSASAAATLVIQNLDSAGEGFNDPTPAAPVGGNTGTTLGQQRLNVFQAAANVWGATLTSPITIVIRASFDPLTCTAASAVLGSAGAYNIWSDFPGAAFANTWYHQALANKLSGTNLGAGDPVDGQDIQARFNSRLGLFPDCLPGSPFYLGLDNNHGTMIDLFTVILHELGHGLGFQTFTSGSTGAPFFGIPALWDHFMLDNTTGKLWVNMTDAERQASAINTRKLAWTGANTTGALPGVLSLGTPQLGVSGPAAGAAAGTYNIGTASFGAPLSSPGVSADIMPVAEQTVGAGQGCEAFSATNTLAVKNNIALINRGVCGFAVKAKNAQNAGAKGVIIANNAPGSAPGLGGTDPTVVIPTIAVSQADGATIRAALAFRSRTRSGVIGLLGINASQYAGADPSGRALLYTPNPFQGGSSVSHYDNIAFPNLLMEPAINPDLTHSVVPPQDLTYPLFQDLGW